jgi:ubiquinone/menaquinone biosynthesis C-methylase UbiE
LALLPDVNGLHILDAACGPGKYAEILLERGANVLGMDLSPAMITEARKRNPEKGQFFVHDLEEPIHMCADASVDIVLCALALHYMRDWQPAIREFARVLKPGGVFVYSVEHPFFEYTYVKSKRYFDVEPIMITWRGFGKAVDVHSFRRSLQECITPVTENGFYIDKLVEPRPVKELEAIDSRRYKEFNSFPAFLCVRAVKRAV